MAQTDIADLEQFIEKQREAVELRDLALKLERVPEFKKLILQRFCVDECARYAQLSADPSLKPEAREDSLALAQAAGHLRRWLSVTVRMGHQAEQEIRQAESEMDELRQSDDK